MYIQVPDISQNQHFPDIFLFESLLNFYVQCMELKGFNILNIVIHCTFIHIASLLVPNLIENMMMVCSVQLSDAVQCFLCMPNFTVTGKQYITGACSLDDMNLLVSYHFQIASCTGKRENTKMGEDGQELGQVYSWRKGEESFLLLHVHNIGYVCRVLN